MMRQFHDLRRHEEGQALVLAAISVLILTLCVLATVNLSYAATQKVRLQNAADAASYTVAAYQARALNFMAYGNRAIVVQTTAQLNLLAIISYLYFSIALYTLAGYIPYIGFIFQFFARLLNVATMILDVIVAFIIPFLDGLNLGIAVTQFAVSTAMRISTGREHATGPSTSSDRTTAVQRVIRSALSS